MSELWDKLNAWLASLSERERRLVTWGGIAAALLLLFALGVFPLYSVANSAEQRVERKRNDLAWMQSVADELRAAGPVQASNASLVVIVDQTARAAGLAAALRDSQPSGTGGIRVRLESAPFDVIVAWLGDLASSHGLIVESATVDRTSRTGIVNASLIMRKG
ncbi:MAG TPA: type II secretion system protein M [Steroidobacteraceae bacterium]|nr:type II secretion system protein M [Steroidobacteraceae bacterium]